MAFYEIRFPTDISSGSQGGPGFNTNVVVIDSGYEKRRIRWPLPRYAFNAAYGVKTADQMTALIEFFYSMKGKAHGFRFKDPLDYKTSPIFQDDPSADDQVLISSAVGGEQDIQLIKSYITLVDTIDRTITKPVNGTVLVKKNSTVLTETTHYTIDYSTGILSLVTPLSATDSLSWGGEFDVPCRFDTDQLDISLNKAVIGETNIPIVEIRI